MKLQFPPSSDLRKKKVDCTKDYRTFEYFQNVIDKLNYIDHLAGPKGNEPIRTHILLN